MLDDDLRRSVLFGGLDEESLAHLTSIARPVRLPAESTVFVQHDPARAFFLLSQGAVKIYKLFRDGRTATLRHVRPGETFGESVLFHDTYPSSAETMEDSALYRFDTEDFHALLLAQPQVAVNLLGAMARLMLLLNSRVEELLLPVPARLGRYLLALADEQLGEPLSPGAPRIVRLPTTKKELAARLGTVPETLSRTFDRFKRAAVIRMSGGGELIEILDFAALRRLAQE
jgi:CRP/FNR family transcriptional regulator, dissimilatory nitrate respiration regulator